MPSPEPQIRALSDPRVARITHYFTHYNEPLLHELMQAPEDRSGITYSLYSDVTSPDHTLKLVDPALATLPPWDGGLRWYRVRNRRLAGPLFWQQGTLRLAWARGHDVLIVTGSYYCLTNWLLAPLARLRRKRLIWWTIGQVVGEPSRLQRWMKRRFLRLADAVLFYGHRERAQAIADGMDPDSLYVVYNSMPLPECLDPPPPAVTAELRAGLFSDPSLPTLIHSGRLRSERRVDLVLKCARALSDEGFPVNVILIGQGPANASLETLTQELRLCGRVHMAGACYDAERLAQLFHASDLCVAPGGIGLLCIQAMAHGVPCITHDDHYGLHAGGHGGQGPEHEAIVPGRTGMLFPNGDFRGLVRCVRQWFATAPPKDAVSTECRRLIRMYYSPRNQADVIDAAVLGIPATHVVQLQDFGHVVDPASTPE
jgi:glycosyltransferase involved in cell wall biosynthesis